MYIVLAILIFGILIFVHELGHFLTAKATGVKVNEFAICMGPVLWQKTVGETTYSLRCIPIGGFCAMEGEDALSENPRAFTSAKWWKRFLILVAGAAMNYLLGLIIVTILFSSAKGFYTPTIDSFFPDSPMQASGLMEGDTFYSIDGERVYLYQDVSMLLERNTTGTAQLVVKRDGKMVQLTDFPLAKIEYEIDGEKQLRYGMNLGAVETGFGALLKNSWYTCIDFSRMVRMGLSDLITGQVGLSDMGGPVTIVHTMSESGKAAENTAEGIQNVFYLAAFIAVNLAVMNLLPIPALDGGRIFFLLVTTLLEFLLHRKINPKYEGYIHAGGMILLLLFMAFITFHDVWMLIFKG